ncbi:MAG: cytochrome c, partial [Holophagales bacterium]|nr:cytochrome c [Holophagales bacterium]
MSERRKGLPVKALIALLIALAVIYVGWSNLFRELPQQIPDQLADDSIEELFKYGSIGTENDQGLPFWIFLVLPNIFPEYLPAPGGYAALGFQWEQGRQLPVGFTRKTIGFERVGINCAICHSGALTPPGRPAPEVIAGMPGNTQDLLAYQRFLFDCASDPRFIAATLLQEIGRITELSWLERQIYRFILIPQTRSRLLEQKEQFEWTDSRPDWGRGRIDPFNPVKLAILNVGVGDTLGNSDMQSLWNLDASSGQGVFHWDGLNTDLHEVVVSSALGDGAVPKSLPMERLAALQEYISGLEPPAFGQYFPVDRALAAEGEPLYQQHCADCHSPGGSQTGQILALDDAEWQVAGVAGVTDPNRAEMWTPEAAQAYNDYSRQCPDCELEHFRSTGGYVNVELNGLWLRAPYLHNGSVPYLSELLEPPERRSKVFYRGATTYDPERVGFDAGCPQPWDGTATQPTSRRQSVGGDGGGEDGGQADGGPQEAEPAAYPAAEAAIDAPCAAA